MKDNRGTSQALGRKRSYGINLATLERFLTRWIGVDANDLDTCSSEVSAEIQANEPGSSHNGDPAKPGQVERSCLG